MSNVKIIDHPLIQEKMTYLRDKNTRPHEFRALLNEVAGLMVYEITRTFPLKEIEVETPLQKTKGNVLANEITLVPIIRAGLEMMSGILNLIPYARVGHLGIYRDKDTLKAVRYYGKLPINIANTEVIVIDPMLATGGSAVDAINYIKEKGAKSLRFVCLVSAPEGVSFLNKFHPDVPIFTAVLDERLNDHGYILPGLGDAGDRLYGTA
jgi:uracil phosphoribosyltransferase